MKNTKGLSQVVTIVIMVVLVLVAAGIVWGVVNNIIQGGVGDINIADACRKISIKPTAAVCDSSNICNVTIQRSATGDEITGLRMIFSDGASTYENKTAGNIATLATQTFSNINTGLTGTVNEVQVAVYLTDAKGEEQTCNQIETLAI